MSPECEPNFKEPDTGMTLRAAKRVLLERSQGRCEARWSDLCTGIGFQSHHIVRQAQTSRHDPEEMLYCCLFCHSKIHDNPAEAITRGFLKPGWAA